jgi:hypothetical protein
MSEITKADVQEVFDHWVQVVKHRDGKRAPTRQPVLGPKRERAIRRALNLYGVQTCKDAIDGVLHSDFHMGNNSRGKIYDDIELILRNEIQIERFLAIKDEHEQEQADWDNVTPLRTVNGDT